MAPAYVCHSSGCYGLERSIVAAVGYIEAVSGLKCHPAEADGFIAVVSDGVPTHLKDDERIAGHAARSRGVRIGSIRGADLDGIDEVA